MTTAQARLLMVCALAGALTTACGGDDENGGGGVTTGNDRDSSMPMDGGDGDVTDERDSGPVDEGPVDSGGDDPKQDAGGDGDVDSMDDDAGEPDCAIDCDTLSDECNTAVCNRETLECEIAPRDDGTACGDPTLDNCTAPDRCMAGVCQARHAAEGTACGDQAVDCRNDDECDGNGQCVDKGFWSKGQSCGDATDRGVCDAPDSCDEAGNCVENLAEVDTVCADGDNPCRFADTCDGLGACVDNGNRLQGVACGGPDEPTLGVCHPVASLCDNAGNCVNQDKADGTSCGSSADTECDNPDRCMGGACVKNYEPKGTGCGDSTDTVCDAPDTCDGFGTCRANHADDNVICQEDTQCTYDRRCNGAGTCNPVVHKPTTTICGNLPPDCFMFQRCDGAGTCLPGGQPAAAGTACGDPMDYGMCDAPDTCDASGNCMDNVMSGGGCP